LARKTIDGVSLQMEWLVWGWDVRGGGSLFTPVVQTATGSAVLRSLRKTGMENRSVDNADIPHKFIESRHGGLEQEGLHYTSVFSPCDVGSGAPLPPAYRRARRGMPCGACGRPGATLGCRVKACRRARPPTPALFLCPHPFFVSHTNLGPYFFRGFRVKLFVSLILTAATIYFFLYPIPIFWPLDLRTGSFLVYEMNFHSNLSQPIKVDICSHIPTTRVRWD